MPTAIKRIIFDTSALNKLAEDRESEALLAGLKSAFTLRLTETNIGEIAATPDANKRLGLLDLCRQLLSAGDCIQPYQRIIEQLIIQSQNAISFDWKSVDVRFRECENEIARREIIDEKLATEQRNHARSCEQEFEKIYDDARHHFDRLFHGAKKVRPGIRDLINALRVTGGAFWSYGISLYERVTKHSPNEQTIRTFIDECPPFRALLLALCVAQYERCIRDLKTGLSYRAGRFDLFMSVYLPYCDQFITADDRQHRCLAEVAREGNLGVEVCSYEDVRQTLTIV